MGRDIWFLSISLDPAIDTPRRLADYHGNFGCKKGWLYLTGHQDDITELRRVLGVYDPDPAIDNDRTQHSGVITFGSDVNDRWAALPGLMDAHGIATTMLRIINKPLLHPRATGVSLDNSRASRRGDDP